LQDKISFAISFKIKYLLYHSKPSILNIKQFFTMGAWTKTRKMKDTKIFMAFFVVFQFRDFVIKIFFYNFFHRAQG